MTAPDGWTLLTAARLLDGSGAGALEDAAVLIEGGTIRAIGRRSEVRPPDGAVATTHEYGDATILPGLVDGHTHLVGIGDGTRGDDLAAQDDDLLLIRATVNARAMLHSGVTTIRENGAKGRIAFSVREAIRRGIADGPSHGRGGPGGDDHRRSPPLVRRRGGRPRRSSPRGPSARQGGRRLHQDHGVGRQHPLLAPVPAGLHAGRAAGDRRRSPASRTPDRRPRRPQRGHRGLPRRRARHDHPLLDDGPHRRLRVPPGPGGPDGRSRRLGQPDDARHPRLALALPRRGGGGPRAGRHGRRATGRAPAAV